MQIRFIRMIDDLFKDAPQSLKTLELKEEMVQNLMEKYRDLIAEGKTDEEAFRIAAGSLGDMRELVRELRREAGETVTVGPSEEAETYTTSEEPEVATATIPVMTEDEVRRRSAMTTAIAVMLFIISPVPFFFMGSRISSLLMFSMVAAGIGLLVFNSLLKGKTKPAYYAPSEEPQEASAEEARDMRERRPMRGALMSSFWLLVTAFYVIFSFQTGMWHISWVIFLFASAVNSLLRIPGVRKPKKIFGLLSGALWTATTGMYFIISFATGGWHITWIIFLIATALNNVLKAYLDIHRK